MLDKRLVMPIQYSEHSAQFFNDVIAIGNYVILNTPQIVLIPRTYVVYPVGLCTIRTIH